MLHHLVAFGSANSGLYGQLLNGFRGALPYVLLGCILDLFAFFGFLLGFLGCARVSSALVLHLLHLLLGLLNRVRFLFNLLGNKCKYKNRSVVQNTRTIEHIPLAILSRT